MIAKLLLESEGKSFSEETVVPRMDVGKETKTLGVSRYSRLERQEWKALQLAPVRV